MRDSLRKSIADAKDPNFERYAKGSVVICNACAKPIFTLERGICLGDRAGKMVSAFKPLRMVDLETLEQREDVDAGVRASIRIMSLEQRRAFLALMREVKTGDPMSCPICNSCFVQVLAVDKHEVLDKAYTIELVTIPPSGKVTAIRGRRISASGDWVH